MVYFVCESCNETLKKAQVDRHLYSCKSCWGVTCVDCNFTFEGDSFREHTSCVSEDQKYQGALFKAPKAKQKNRGVNEIWTDAVLLASANASKGVAPKALSGNLTRMADLGNVPRQEKKFKNFVKNSMRVFDDASVAKLWEYLDGVREEISKEEKEQKEAAVVAVTIPVPEKKNAEKSTKKGKKRSREEGAAEPAADSDSSSKRRVKDQQPVEEVEADADAARQGGDGVDATVQKALAKAAIAILKKAPKKELCVKQLVKQAAAATRGKGGAAAELDDKRLRRALKQRLKKEGGLGRVTVVDNVATYSKVAVASA